MIDLSECGRPVQTVLCYDEARCTDAPVWVSVVSGPLPCCRIRAVR